LEWRLVDYSTNRTLRPALLCPVQLKVGGGVVFVSATNMSDL
jgi:hypothetical protein